jgi:hypothetical protein
MVCPSCFQFYICKFEAPSIVEDVTNKYRYSLCDLVVRVSGCKPEVPRFIPGATRFSA